MRSSFFVALVCLVFALLPACGSDTSLPLEEYDAGAETLPDTATDETTATDTFVEETRVEDTGTTETSADAAPDGDAAPSEPTLTVNDVTITEGNSGTLEATFTVTLSPPTSKTVTVAYGTIDDSAVAGTDYVAAAGTLTFAPGVTTQTIKITVNGDALDEANETFKLELSLPTEALIGDDLGLGTITDDDDAPTLSIGDVTVVEGNAGTLSATLTVTLSAASGLPVTASFATVDGTATTAGSDYASSSGTITFAPGTTTQTVAVVVNADTLYEINETATVTLSAPTNATLSKATRTVTIEDDDVAPTLSIDDIAVVEGNSGTTSATFTVTLSAASGRTTTVSYATSDGTATAGLDYVAIPTTTLTFAPGETTKTVVVTVNGDTGSEPVETFDVTLSAPTNATLVKAVGTASISNDDSGAPTLSINDVTVAEGNSGTSVLTFTVTASSPPASGQTYTVAYATADGTASPPDYVSTSGVLTFNPGESSKTVAVTINGDARYEADETLLVQLSAATTAVLGRSIGRGTITNDDAAPTVSIGNASVAEGASGTRPLDFTVTLSAAADLPVTVKYASSDGTATTAGSDYVASAGTLVFAPGTTSQVASLAVYGDTLNEGDETLSVTLSAPTNATLGTAVGTGTITNDDALPTLSIGNATVTEGNSGVTSIDFPVTLSAPSGRAVTVAYATANGTASAGSDYTATTGTLTFAAGELVKHVIVPVNGDTVAEPTEDLNVNLSAPVNATIVDGTGNGQIFNDDGTAPLLNIGDVTLDEGNSGTKNATFTVTLSTAAIVAVTVDYATANDTAVAGADFTSTAGTLTFMPGETSKTISVPVVGDGLDENAEKFFVNLSNPVSATIADGQGVGTINDDDASPSLSVGDTSVTEGSGSTNATLTISLSTASGRTITVNYATADGTAVTGGVAGTGGKDYTASSGTVTFAPGETSKTVTLVVLGDATDEPDSESFNVTLSGATNAVIADGTGVVTITDDDALPSLSVADYSDTEGGSILGGSKAFTITVTLAGATSRTVTVQYATANGTATAGSDYTAASGTLTFAPGETSKTLTVTVFGNIAAEANETFFVNLSTPTNSTIADASATVTIVNDD